MRTSGPCLPSGRRSVSTCNGGSWLGALSSRRTCSTTDDAYRAASASVTPGAGSHTNITSASEPYPSSRPPSRPMPMTAIDATALTGRPHHRVQRRLQHRHPHLGQRHAHRPQRHQPEQVRRRHPQQLLAAQRPGGGDRAVQVAVPGHGAAQRVADGHRVAADQRVGVGQQRQHLRRAHQQVRHELRRAQQRGQPVDHRALVAQQPQVPGRLGQRLGHLPVRQQPAVRVRVVANRSSSTGSSAVWIRARRETPLVSASMCFSAPSGAA